VVFSALDFSCPAAFLVFFFFFFFPFFFPPRKKERQQLHPVRGLKQKWRIQKVQKKRNVLLVSQNIVLSHMYWCGRLTLAKGQTPTQPLVSLLSGAEGENRMRILMGQYKDGEIAYHLLLWAKHSGWGKFI